MAKKTKKKKIIKRENKNKLLLLLIAGTLLILFFLTQIKTVGVQKVADTGAKKSLQLGTFQFTEPPTQPPKQKITQPPLPTSPPAAPPDYGTCVVNQPIDNCTCGSSRVRWLYCPPKKPMETPNCIEGDPVCEGIIHDFPECTWWCMDKPIIYLYPEIPTFVDVKIETPGEIIISDPLYPKGGWKDVLAYPNGNLSYQGKQYRELFYESGVTEINPPKTGFIIESKNLEKELKTFTKKLGLNIFESSEFLTYWVPTLQGLNKKYILVSILDKGEKERVDSVHITPNPDTRIEFMAYFKGLDHVIPTEKFIYPHVPERVGFTIVEWGGTIDRNL